MDLRSGRWAYVPRRGIGEEHRDWLRRQAWLDDAGDTEMAEALERHVMGAPGSPQRERWEAGERAERALPVRMARMALGMLGAMCLLVLAQAAGRNGGKDSEGGKQQQGQAA